MLARRYTGRDSGFAKATVFQDDRGLNGREPTGIQNFAGSYVDDRGGHLQHFLLRQRQMGATGSKPSSMSNAVKPARLRTAIPRLSPYDYRLGLEERSKQPE